MKWQNVAGPFNLPWWATKSCGARQPGSLREAQSKSQGAAHPSLCSWMTHSATPVGTRRQSAWGNALRLATSSPRNQVIESHVNNVFGDYFYRINPFWSNQFFALGWINSQSDSIFSQNFYSLYFVFFKGHLTEIFWYSVINDVTRFFWVTLMKLNENIFSLIPDHKTVYLDLLFKLFWHAEFTWQEGGSCFFISSSKSQKHY